MANENETVEQVHTDVFGRIRVASSLDEDSMIHNSAVADLLANIDARYVAAYKRELAARDAEIARLRAAIKPVLEVQLKDEDDCKGIGRNELTTPCAVCDWWTGECDQECEVLAVFKAAKECQRICKELESSNG